MSFVTAAPEMVASAASDLASIGSTIGEANAAAAAPTTGVLPAAADEVSAGIASLFGSHAQVFQALSARAASFHQQFVQLMTGTAAQYVSAEAANASPMTTLTVPSLGYGNTGTSNVGFFNTGTNNFGIGNTGNFNAGIGNTGSVNLGFGNFSPNNLISFSGGTNPMPVVSAFGGIGIGNAGFNNIGIGNTGNNNAGLPLPAFVSLLGVGNNGSFNAGLFNFGSFDSGIGNTGSNLYGVGLTGNNQFGIGPLSIAYPFPPLPQGIPYPFGLS
jgi:PPE-repeat protein